MSKVWLHFDKCPGSTNVICKSCNKIINRPVSNTTNLWKHYEKCSVNNNSQIVRKERPKNKPTATKKFPKRSPVWNWYQREHGSDVAICLRCRRVVNCRSGNTAGLWRHKTTCSQTVAEPIDPQQQPILKKVRLKPMPSVRSEIWKYFVKNPLDSKSTICLSCQKIVSRPFGNTTNLWVHHKRCFRKRMLSQASKSPTDRKPSLEENNDISKTPLEIAEDLHKENSESNDQSYQQALIKEDKQAFNTSINNDYQADLEANKVHMDIALFLITDLPHLAVVFGSGFKNMMQQAYPNVKDISPKFVLKCLAVAKQKLKFEITQSLLNSASAVSLSVQVQKDKMQNNFLSVLAHYVNPVESSFKSLEAMLAFVKLPEELNDSEILTIISDQIKPWLHVNAACSTNPTNSNDEPVSNNLNVSDEQSQSLVSASEFATERNMQSFKKNMGVVLCDKAINYEFEMHNQNTADQVKSLACLRSQLQNCLSKVLAKFNLTYFGTPLQHAIELVKYFKQNAEAARRLTIIQVECGRPQPLQLIFGSLSENIFFMLQRICELKDEICMLAKTSDPFCSNLTDLHWEVYLVFISALRPFEKAFSYLNGCDLLLGEGIPVVLDLKASLERICAETVVQFKPVSRQLANEIDLLLNNKMLGDPEYFLSTFLHPSFRHRMSNTVLQKAESMIQSITAKGSNESIYKEVEEYKSQSLSIGTNPIYYWLDCRCRWPALSQLALNSLAAPLCLGTPDEAILNSAAVCFAGETKEEQAYLQDVVFLKSNLAKFDRFPGTPET